MILDSIELKNFRSHRDTKLNFSETLNYIIGGNGEGKTSILESIYYLCTTKGYNSRTDSEVVSFSEDDFEIKGLFKDLTENKVNVFYSLLENKKLYFRDGKQVSRSADIIGKFPVVILTPADHAITQGSPGERRKFVDSVISQASETYLSTLLDYNKTIRQRSSLLNQIKEQRRSSLFVELDAWTEKLIKTGADIIKFRIRFTEELNNYIKESYLKIMDEDETPQIKYSYLDDYAGSSIESEFSNLLMQKRDEELRRSANLIGPHRDDFIFEVNGLNLKTFGSQGQHKTFQVALRFAQFFYLKEVKGRKPIFLLDDVFGELDANRSSKISVYLREVGQAFITLTDFADFSFLTKKDDDKLIRLNKGTAVYA